MRTTMGVVASMMLAAACASAPSQPASVNPEGIFDFSTEVEGTAVNGSLEVRRGANGYEGTLSTDVTEPIPITGVTVDGQQVTIVAQAPDSEISMFLVFTGDTFTGTWSYAGMGGTLTGRRRAAPA